MIFPVTLITIMSAVSPSRAGVLDCLTEKGVENVVANYPSYKNGKHMCMLTISTSDKGCLFTTKHSITSARKFDERNNACFALSEKAAACYCSQNLCNANALMFIAKFRVLKGDDGSDIEAVTMCADELDSLDLLADDVTSDSNDGNSSSSSVPPATTTSTFFDLLSSVSTDSNSPALASDTTTTGTLTLDQEITEHGLPWWASGLLGFAGTVLSITGFVLICWCIYEKCKKKEVPLETVVIGGKKEAAAPTATAPATPNKNLPAVRPPSTIERLTEELRNAGQLEEFRERVEEGRDAPADVIDDAQFVLKTLEIRTPSKKLKMDPLTSSISLRGEDPMPLDPKNNAIFLAGTERELLEKTIEATQPSDSKKKTAKLAKGNKKKKQ